MLLLPPLESLDLPEPKPVYGEGLGVVDDESVGAGAAGATGMLFGAVGLMVAGADGVVAGFIWPEAGF